MELLALPLTVTILRLGEFLAEFPPELTITLLVGEFITVELSLEEELRLRRGEGGSLAVELAACGEL